MKSLTAQPHTARIRLRSYRRALGITLALWLTLAIAQPALASSGSYATAGTGTYAQSLWWLDFSGYSNASAAAGGQAFSFTLPSGAGTLSTTLALNGATTLSAVAAPAWSAGGAIGHGAYNGTSGNPDLYWIGQTGTATVTLSNFVVKDAAGNPRSFTLYAADGENTNSGESITYTSTAPWKLIDTVNYYASFNGVVPTLAGTGTTVVTETAANDNDYNASIVVGTQNPTQASAALAGNEAVMFAVALPTVALTVSISGRVNAGDQFTAGLAYSSPASSLKVASTSGTATTITTGATSLIGTNSVTLTAGLVAGSPSALSYYTGSIACINSGPGAAGYGGANTVLPSGAGVTFTVIPQAGDAVACTLTLTAATQTLTGTVYSDTNHDAALDNGETGMDVAGLFIKLAPSSGGACQTPATIAGAVTTATGAYSLTGVAAGTYCLILTNSNALSNTTAYTPPGYVGTEAAGSIRTVTVSASPTPVQNFGFFSGSIASLEVFSDTGTGTGTANDGIQNGTEVGIANVVITASSGTVPLTTTMTNATGGATLWLPSSAQGTTITVQPTAPTGNTPTAGSAGNTSGSYSRPLVTFTLSNGQLYTGVSFGLIPSSALAPSGAASVAPGGIVYYPHSFTAGSAGQVTFASSATSSPTLAGWGETIYLDSGCSGQFAAGDTLITAAISVTAGQIVCLLLREFAPATAPANATDRVTLSAKLIYNGSAAPAPATLTQSDLTTVSGSGSLQVTKRVQNVTTGGALGVSGSASPGQTLQYQITVTNLGSTPVSTLLVDDATPAFTTFVSASCPAVLPAGLTACTVTTQPAPGGVGAMQWTFAGTLTAGAQTAGTFQVQVAP